MRVHSELEEASLRGFFELVVATMIHIHRLKMHHPLYSVLRNLNPYQHTVLPHEVFLAYLQYIICGGVDRKVNDAITFEHLASYREYLLAHMSLLQAQRRGFCTLVLHSYSETVTSLAKI